MTKIDDEAVFTRKEFRYGVDCRDAAGFGFWQLAFANKRALTPTTCGMPTPRCGSFRLMAAASSG